jgi:hypothetical protein
LGIDIGTTGISAVLLHQQRCQLYPIYWTDPLATLSGESKAERQFRLPAIAPLAERTGDRMANTLTLQDWKPHLNLADPSGSPQRRESVFPWSESRSLALQQIVQATQALLSQLRPAIDRLTTEAVGLDLAEWQIALQSLAGVIVSCAADATVAYRSNVQAAVLGAGLVSAPEQVYFAEEAIAAFLSTLGSSGSDLELVEQPPRPVVAQDQQQGNTLILCAGASRTELAIVTLPTDLSKLTAADFLMRSLPYAGTAIDQDVLCQLIYPALVEKLEASSEWLAVFADLFLPAAGEPDVGNRDRLRQRLNNSPAGQTLQETARTLKLKLQQTSQFTVQLDDYTGWQHTFLRQDVGSQVLLPYIQRLNRELNSLLAQADLSVMQVNQVICTGGTASLGAIARWLRQKLPNAMIIQDTYRPTAHRLGNCSRIAYGLAMLPLYPQLTAPEGERSGIAQIRNVN